MRPQYTSADVARFWRKVDRSGDCWVWTAGRFNTGYGMFSILYGTYHTHRVAWLFTHDEWPALFVCHRCDNRLCVRPEHLFLGTNLDNMRDAVSKGRLAVGARHGSHTHPERWRRR